MKAIIKNREECTACGLCEAICPEVFGMSDEDGLVDIVGEVTEDNRESAEEAAESCPVEILEIEE